MPVLAAVSLFMMIAGLGLQMAGDAEESSQREKQARDNKRLADMAAADAVQRGTREAGQTRMAGSQLIGDQKVAAAASGVDPSVGTPANLMAGTRAQVELEAATQENDAAREAWGLKTHGMQYLQAAEGERKARPLRAAGTALGGAGRIADAGARYQETGAK